MRRALVAVVALVVAIGCSSEIVETVPTGNIRQLVQYSSYESHPKLDLVIVVNADRSERGAALVDSAVAGVRASATRLVDTIGPVWNPVEIRAFIIRASDGTVRSPEQDIGLTWSERDATGEGAEAFVTSVAAAIRASAADSSLTEGLVAVVHRTLAALRVPPNTEREFLLFTTEDDARAQAARDVMLAEPRRDSSDHARDTFVVALPGTRTSGGLCKPAAAPALEGWAKANHLTTTIAGACDALGFYVSGRRHFSWCFRNAVTVRACRVRALLPRGRDCDSGRGWRSVLDRRALPAPEYAGLTICDVAPIEGEGLPRCSGDRSYGALSGWCLPEASPQCPGPLPALVGGAAPAWATIETTCDVE